MESFVSYIVEDLKSVVKGKGKFVVFAVLVLILFACASSIVETVQKGSYDIVQYPVSGKIEAKMNPGMYYQGWGDVETWPKSQTFLLYS